MCGIFGYAGKISGDKSFLAHKLLSRIAFYSEVRGIDSTGFSCKYQGGPVITDKMPYRAGIFVRASHKFKRLRRKMPEFFIGHTRLGTGSTPLINNNNHPFYGSYYHMIHNGVVPSWRDVQKKQELSMTSETDSEVILRFLEKERFNKKRTKDAVENLLGNVWGNMAVALLEIDEPKVWLFRNENPISVYSIPKKIFGDDVYFFASLDSIFNNAWKDVFDHLPHKDDVKSDYLKSNKLYSISPASTFIKGDGWHKFVVYNLNIKDEFSKPHQYSRCNTTTGSTRRVTYYRQEHYFSKVIDENKPQLGCDIPDDVIVKIQKGLAEKDGKKKITIDGMTADEYAGLNTLINDLYKVEAAHFSKLKEKENRIDAQDNRESESDAVGPAEIKSDDRQLYTI